MYYMQVIFKGKTVHPAEAETGCLVVEMALMIFSNLLLSSSSKYFNLHVW